MDGTGRHARFEYEGKGIAGHELYQAENRCERERNRPALLFLLCALCLILLAGCNQPRHQERHRQIGTAQGVLVQGNPILFRALEWDAEAGFYHTGGGGGFDPQTAKSINGINKGMPNRISMNVTVPKQTRGATFGERVNAGLHAAGSAISRGVRFNPREYTVNPPGGGRPPHAVSQQVPPTVRGWESVAEYPEDVF